MPASSSNQLYVIGNGFDLHHWAEVHPNTSYNSFAAFLKQNNVALFHLLCQTCALPHDTLNKEWCAFEDALADFEPEEIFEKVCDYIDDANPHEIGGAGWEAEKHIKALTQDMRKALNDFIYHGSNFPNALRYPINIDDVRLQLPQDALYLSFNYTDTLERFYQIPPSKICYIHGKAGENSNLKIGHGVDSFSHNDTPRAEQNLEYTYLDSISGQNPWEDCNADCYSISENLVRAEISMYWPSLFKDAKFNIQAHTNFFEECHNICCVVIMGHSLSEIDFPYFEEIKRLVSSDTTWHVSFHTPEARERNESILMRLGVAERYRHQFEMQAIVNYRKPR